MGGTAKRIGTGIATGGASELDRAGIGFTAGLTKRPGASMSGGKGGKNGGPSAPDFGAAAEAQSRSSRNDTNGAFGSSQWTQGPDGRWTQSMSLAPGLQGAADNLMGQIGSSSQLDPRAVRDQAIDSAYKMQASRLDPRFAQAQSSLESRLAAEGFSRGDEGWRNASAELGRDRNDAYQQALYGAQSGAGNTAYAQALAGNMQPYQQLAQIQGMGERNGYAALNNAQPSQDLLAAMQRYSADQQRFGNQQAGKNSAMSGAGSMAGLFGRKNGNLLPPPSNPYLDGMTGADFSPGGSHEGWT